MFNIYKKSEHGVSELGWLHSRFHFSFAEYHNPLRLKFGALRVLNDDVIEPGTGFGTHPHSDMEIVTYVINGELTHIDSMGNERVLSRGHVQYISAGSGITHSESNNGREKLHLIQMWMLPSQTGLKPNYGDQMFDWQPRVNKWMKLIDGGLDAPIHIKQDVTIYASYLEEKETLAFELKPKRQLYLVNLEGRVTINGNTLSAGDAIEVRDENLNIEAGLDSHMILLEMKS